MSDIAQITHVIENGRMNNEMKEVLKVIVTCFSKLISVKDDRIDGLESRVNDLENELQTLKDSIDNNDQYQ